MAWDKFYDDKYTLDYPYELEDLELLGDHLFVIGVPYSIEPEFKRNVIGAAKSFFAGHKSIDYTIKQYGKYWNFDTKHDKAQDVLFSLCSMLRPGVTLVNHHRRVFAVPHSCEK